MLLRLAVRSSIGNDVSSKILPEEWPYDATKKLPPVGIADSNRGSRSCALIVKLKNPKNRISDILNIFRFKLIQSLSF